MRLSKQLVALIQETARETTGVGELAQSLKWGQLSFAPKKPRIGSSVRIEERANGDVALMFICHTGLVSDFRDRYGDELQLEGNRAIVLNAKAELPEDALKHCIAQAFTYYINKKSGRNP